ncbi:MAG: hypothetical protein IT365_04455 [Candidatus Hydrogenedentes bacterium]|nr:hypothetical protein [Candidatus Hydrogenedentota bacterium]
MTKLDLLLDSLHPSRTYDAILRRAVDAMDLFPVTGPDVRDEVEFRNLMVRFFVHLDGIVFGTGRRWIDPAHDWVRCSEVLHRLYGPDGPRLAVRRAVYGIEGGLRRVFRDTAHGFAEQLADNEVAARVAHYWCGLSTQERFATVAEYRRKWAHLLPEDMLREDEARMLVHFPRYLEAHPKLIRSLGQAVRR